MQTPPRSTPKVMFLLFLALSLTAAMLLPGCPDPKPPTEQAPKDGGDTDETTQPLTCEKGTLCITVSGGVRGCDVLLKNKSAIASPEVAFGDALIGQFKFRDSRLALSFIANSNEDIDANKSSVLIKLPDGIGDIELGTAVCYDKSGAKVDGAKVELQKP